MRTGLVTVACSLLLAFLLIACNNYENEGITAGEKHELKDTSAVAIDTALPPPGTYEEDSDYTKRNINLSHQQWLAFKKTYHLNDDFAAGNRPVTGDFNGDGKRESIFIVAPTADTLTKDAFQECIGGCDSYIIASDTAMMILKIHSNLGGDIKNIGDIDGDAADEIMVYPSWWQSNWNPYRIYSMNTITNTWSYLVEPVSIFANELEKRISFIKKAKQPGFISAYTTTTGEDGNFSSGYKDFKIIK